ncbi:MAG: hypothetical protein V1672_03300 [Candidatus Diapherotrites archaeon]
MASWLHWRRMMMENNQLTRKSYNPFKMGGSWIGLILYLSIIFIALQTEIPALSYFLFYPINLSFLLGLILFFCPECLVMHLLVKVILLILSAIVGFLLGWGIHSLVRRFRK